LRVWRSRRCGIIAGVAATLALAACGSGARQDAQEPKGRFPVAISTASFPAAQTLSQHTHLVIAVRNAGSKTIPDIAVTICNVTCAFPAPKGEGSTAQAFGQDVEQPYLANPSRPIWVIDSAPGACKYSCAQGGQGSAVTSYTNTWALGPLRAGQTVRFDWALTAVSAGKHTVAWEVAAGLNGRARAIAGDGGKPQGSFAVDIGAKPPQSYVNNNGQIVTTGQ
jgi:hypothetical protein